MRATIVPPVLRNQSNEMVPGWNPSSFERSKPLYGVSSFPVRSDTGRLIVNVPGFGLAVTVATAADEAGDGAGDALTDVGEVDGVVCAPGCCEATGQTGAVAEPEAHETTTRRTNALIADRPSRPKPDK